MGDSVADNSADAKDEKRLDDGEEKALPVIDWEFAMSQCMDDREFLEELIEEMLKDEESKLAEMQSGVDSDDHDVLQEAAHYIKGAAANLGLKGIQHAATELDSLGKELKSGTSERLGERQGLVDSMKQEFKRLREFQEREFPKEKSSQ